MLHGRPRFDQLLRRIVERRYFDWPGHYRAWRERPAGSTVVKFESLFRQPNFFRAGRVGQWQGEMSPEMEELFWREHHEGMSLAGYLR